VHCIYFVATGTLDDILWKLLEKKFRELGEFVEGKEEHKMIVHKIYKNEDELHAMFEVDNRSDDDEDLLENDEDDEFAAALDNDLERDIEQLAQKEQQELLLAERDRDDDDGEGDVSGVRPQAHANDKLVQDDGKGKSQDDAIALSDSEDDEVKAEAPSKAVNLMSSRVFDPKGTLPHCRFYTLTVGVPSIGVGLAQWKRRIVVKTKKQVLIDRLGKGCKPEVGDILMGINHEVVPLLGANFTFQKILAHLKRRLESPEATKIWFAEDEEFRAYWKNYALEEISAKPSAALGGPAPAKKRPIGKVDGVIELD